MNKIIYFDLDGVLTDFDQGVANVFDIEFRDSQGDELTTEQKEIIFNHPTFFSDLPVMAGAKEMVRYARMLCDDVQILTATGYSNPIKIAQQKKEWAKQNFPGVPCHCVERSNEKARYAWPGDGSIILVDDRLKKSCLPFREAGGIAIHHTSIEKTKMHLGKLFANRG